MTEVEKNIPPNFVDLEMINSLKGCFATENGRLTAWNVLRDNEKSDMVLFPRAKRTCQHVHLAAATRVKYSAACCGVFGYDKEKERCGLVYVMMKRE